MILCYFLKLLADCALYFVAANCFMGVANVAIDSYWPAILLALVGTLAYWMEEKYSKYRFLCIPLLALVLLFAKGVGTGGILLIPAFYVALCIKDKRYFTDAEMQSNIFKWGLAGAFVVYFLFALVIGVQWVVQYIMLFLFTNMFLMRLLRQNPAHRNDKEVLLNNALNVGLALGVTAVLTMEPVLRLMKSLWQLFYDKVLEPISSGIAFGVYLLFGGIAKEVGEYLDSQKWYHSTKKLNIGSGNWINDEILAPLEEELGVNSIAVLVVQILLIIAGLVGVFFLVKKMRRGRNLQEGTAVREHRRAVTVRREEEKAPLDLIAPKEPRAAVRFYYRKFLQLCKKLEYQFPASFTSKQIENSVSKRFGEEPTQHIRQTYIRARYSSEEITDADVAAMKEQVNDLREKYEPKKQQD